MSVQKISEFREKQEQRKFEEQIAADDFMMYMWQEAVDKERYLPRELSIKLIEQIMLDHGINLQDLSE